MSVLEDRFAYKSNPYADKPQYGDFTPFYITVTICAIIGISIFILNIALGCCSRYSDYWNDRHTGNRWIVSLWTATPHRQPPLDLTELEDVEIVNQYQKQPFNTPQIYTEYPSTQPPSSPTAPHLQKIVYAELKKRESEI